MLVDSSNILYSEAQSNTKGNYVLKVLEKYSNIIQELYPDILVNVQDIGKSKHRLAMDSSYKAQRLDKAKSKKEQDALDIARSFRKQVKYYLGDMFYSIGIQDIEADDLISMLYLDLKDEYDVTIVSSDKDILQLGAKQFDPKQMKYITAENKLGLKPSQVIIYLAMLGDTADNIKGLKGVGEATAKYLLKKYDSIKTIRSIEEGLESDWRVRNAITLIQSKSGLESLKHNYNLIKLLSYSDLNEADKLLYDEFKLGLSEFKLSFPSDEVIEKLELEWNCFGVKEGLYDIYRYLGGEPITDIFVVKDSFEV